MFRNFFYLDTYAHITAEEDRIVNFLNSFSDESDLLKKIKTISFLQEDPKLLSFIENEIVYNFDDKYFIAMLSTYSGKSKVKFYNLLHNRLLIISEPHLKIKLIKSISSILIVPQEEIIINLLPIHIASSLHYYWAKFDHDELDMLENINDNVRYNVVKFILDNKLGDRVYNYIILYILGCNKKAHNKLIAKLTDPNILDNLLRYVMDIEENIFCAGIKKIENIITENNIKTFFAYSKNIKSVASKISLLVTLYQLAKDDLRKEIAENIYSLFLRNQHYFSIYPHVKNNVFEITGIRLDNHKNNTKYIPIDEE